MEINIDVRGLIPMQKYLSNIERQIPFATALALTKTAKEVQREEIAHIRSAFTVRGSWLREGGKFGVGIVRHGRGIGEAPHRPARAFLRGSLRRQRARQQRRGEPDPRQKPARAQGRPGTLAPARTNTGMRPSGAFTVSVTGPST